MRDREFVPIFRKLAVAYGSRLDDTAETMQVYYEILQDMGVEMVQAAVLEFIAGNSAFPPTPGQVRGKAIELSKRANKVPAAHEAWGELMEAPANGQVSWSEERDDGWHIYNQPYQFSHPVVEKVARNMGWPNRFWTNSLAADRARFLQAYEDEVGRATGEATSLPQVSAYIARGSADMKKLLSGFRRDALDREE